MFQTILLTWVASSDRLVYVLSNKLDILIRVKVTRVCFLFVGIHRMTFTFCSGIKSAINEI